MPSLIVFITAGSSEEAARIADALVEERLAACVNVIPGVQSVYRWREQVERASEWMLLAKTTEDVLPALTLRVKALHSYTVPEILAVPVHGGSDDYLAWLAGQVGEVGAAAPHPDE
jgi:periplasmic divalent cation tolerance protein